MVLKLRVDNENRLKMVNVLSLLSMGEHVLSARTNLSACDLGQLGFNIEAEAAELLYVH
jgi:hypothetical protein